MDGDSGRHLRRFYRRYRDPFESRNRAVESIGIDDFVYMYDY